MILLALLLPVVMMAFLFAADALEDLIFPPPAAADEEAPAAGIARTRDEETAMHGAVARKP